MAIHQLADVISIVASGLEPSGKVVVLQTQLGEPWIAALAWVSMNAKDEKGDVHTYGSPSAVTLVLLNSCQVGHHVIGSMTYCAALPVRRFTLDGQHNATVQ